MKKLLALILSLVMALGCLSLASAETTGLNVLLLVPSTEGSYFSASVLAVKELETKYPGTTTETIAMGAIPMEKASAEYELESYLPYFEDACASGKYDLIVTMGAECNAALIAAAQKYPEQKFFSADLQGIDGTTLATAPLSNVYGLMYKNKDIGYLAGYVAC